MLKQKIDTAALFAQKKAEVQNSARTLLTLDGQENAYIPADELTEELLAIPETSASRFSTGKRASSSGGISTVSACISTCPVKPSVASGWQSA